MGHALPSAQMTMGDFLAWEAAQPVKHEFVAGEVFAMAGAEDRHVTVTGNVYMALRTHLRGTPCRAYFSDMKLQVVHANSVFYPDVMVTGHPSDHASGPVKHEPTLLVEVLSPSTAAYDRGDKFAAYRRIASLREYMLVDVDSRRTDVYRKADDGLWVLHPSEPGEPVSLASVGLTLTADELFAEVEAP